MKKIITGFSILVMVSGFGQNKKFSMQDAVLGLGSNLKVENISQMYWIPNTDSYTESVSTSNKTVLVKRTLPELKTDTIAIPTDFTMNTVPFLRWLDSNTAFYSNGQKMMFWDLKTAKSNLWIELPENSEDQKYDSKTRSFAYVLDNNLYMQDANQQLHQITKDGSYEIVNGKSVHRDEFGIDGGIFFSPQGNYLAFYRMDQSMVEDLSLIHI